MIVIGSSDMAMVGRGPPYVGCFCSDSNPSNVASAT